MKKTICRLRCLLTDEEKINVGRQLAEATNDLEEIEEDKKQVVADFKAKSTAAEALISSLGNKLRSGYEFRDVSCFINFDQPEKGQKQTVRSDTGEVVSTEIMSEEEKQRELALEEE